ncbi:MarR family winged helix-turn-helix transcriptional regulator [Amycolatopsis albispora]|nr:MarR family winged helix-turn-helix transcriptional regulator [Amycolatopsis albispora]
MSEPPVAPERTELSLLALFAGWAMTGEVQRRLGEDGFGDLRFNDGFVVQHVLAGPLTVSALAERMGVTQQAASKAVADLDRRGVLTRKPAPDDARARLLELTEFGRASVAATRRHRAALESEMEAEWGADRVADARALLAEILRRLGGTEAVKQRRVRPPA